MPQAHISIPLTSSITFNPDLHLYFKDNYRVSEAGYLDVIFEFHFITEQRAQRWCLDLIGWPRNTTMKHDGTTSSLPILLRANTALLHLSRRFRSLVSCIRCLMCMPASDQMDMANPLLVFTYLL